MSLMVLRIVIGIEGIVFAIVLMWVAAALSHLSVSRKDPWRDRNGRRMAWIS